MNKLALIIHGFVSPPPRCSPRANTPRSPLHFTPGANVGPGLSHPAQVSPAALVTRLEVAGGAPGVMGTQGDAGCRVTRGQTLSPNGSPSSGTCRMSGIVFS